jgi:hypothetical protein
MDNFFKQVSDPTWWISVVVVGLLINLASDYLKPLLDRILGSFSNARKRANEKQALLFQDDLQKLVNDPSKVTDLKFDIIYFNLRTVLLIAISLAINAVLEIIFPINILFSVTPLVYALVNMNNERYYRKVLAAYEKSKI